jgi:hypothetical protein
MLDYVCIISTISISPMYQYCVLYMVWWWLIEPKHVAECLIVNIDYQHMLCFWLIKLIYIITKQRDGSYQKCVKLGGAKLLTPGRNVFLSSRRSSVTDFISVNLGRLSHNKIGKQPQVSRNCTLIITHASSLQCLDKLAAGDVEHK